MRFVVGALACVSLLACGSSGASGSGASGGGASGGGASSGTAARTCTAPGIASAHSIAFRRPEGCTLSTPPAMQDRVVIASAEELATVLTCQGNARPDIDFTTHDLVLSSFSMSPAHGGSDVYDDGTTVTFVTYFRSPCPDDPRPMPMPGVHAFVLPKGATRQYTESSCTLPDDC